MTTKQMTVALRLGLAFGHEWARVMLGEFWHRQELVTYSCVSWPEDRVVPSVEEIHETTLRARDDHSLSGISHPNFQSGSLVHTTNSGRVNWRIKPDGDAWLSVNRPEQEWIVIVDIPFYDIENHTGTGVSIRVEYPELTFVRHLLAAKEAVGALLGNEGAEIAFSPEIMAQAKPDPVPELTQ